MRLLPRTPHGTWVLAAVLWLAGVAATWALWPVTPRQIVRLHQSAMVLGVGPDGRTLLTADLRFGQGLGQPGPVKVRDLQTGRFIDTVHDTDTRFDVVRRSRDGRWCFVGLASPDLGRPRVIDVAASRAEELGHSCTPPPLGYSPEAAFTADGRLMAFPSCEPEAADIVLWDLDGRRIHGVLPGVKFPAAFSEDGRWIAAAFHDPEGTRRVRVFDVATLAPRITLNVGPKEYVKSMRLSDGGAYLVASVTAYEPRSDYRSFCIGVVGVRGWDVATGLEILRGSAGDHSFELIGNSLVAVDYATSGFQLRWTDLTTGKVRRSQPLGSAEFLSMISLSPNRRWLAIQRKTATVGPLQHIATAMRVPWPFNESDRRVFTMVFDAETGSSHGELPTELIEFIWSPDGRTLVDLELNDDVTLRLWDMPPPAPYRPTAVVAAALALLIGGLATWRARRQRRTMTSPPAPSAVQTVL